MQLARTYVFRHPRSHSFICKYIYKVRSDFVNIVKPDAAMFYIHLNIAQNAKVVSAVMFSHWNMFIGLSLHRSCVATQTTRAPNTTPANYIANNTLGTTAEYSTFEP